MHKLNLITIVAVSAFLYGCSMNTTYVTDMHRDADRKLEEERAIAESNNSSIYDVGYETGNIYIWLTSFYGEKFHNRYTANGEIFDMSALTCAHKELPFNTVLRVTNPKNEKSVVVHVNDRGPFIEGRELDLSQGAAIKLGMHNDGVNELLVEILELPN